MLASSFVAPPSLLPRPRRSVALGGRPPSLLSAFRPPVLLPASFVSTTTGGERGAHAPKRPRSAAHGRREAGGPAPPGNGGAPRRGGGGRQVRVLPGARVGDKGDRPATRPPRWP